MPVHYCTVVCNYGRLLQRSFHFRLVWRSHCSETQPRDRRWFLRRIAELLFFCLWLVSSVERLGAGSEFVLFAPDLVRYMELEPAFPGAWSGADHQYFISVRGDDSRDPLHVPVPHEVVEVGLLLSVVRTNLRLVMVVLTTNDAS